MNAIMKKTAAILAAAVFISTALSGCFAERWTGNREGSKNDPAEESRSEQNFFAMNTYITMSAYGENAESSLQEAENRIAELENAWSVTNENSDLFQVNHSNGNPITLSDDTADIIRFSLDMAEKTRGAFEPSIYPVLTAWGFTTEENRIPDNDEIEELLQNTGYSKIIMNGNEIRLPDGMELDLGAVGKGYAGDEAAAILEQNGVTSALLNLGGNVQAVGSRPDGSDWRLGIRNPSGEGNVGVLSVSDCAVVTSGNYERYFVGEDGNTYGHIIDPSTGYPVNNGLMSVTVITKEGKTGDALSTALYVMGLDEAARFWRDNQYFDMLIIADNGEIYMTESAAEKFSLDASYEAENIYLIHENGIGILFE